jgi:hypothetical protein
MDSDIITDAINWIDENFRDKGYEMNVDIYKTELDKAHVWYKKLKEIENTIPNTENDQGEYQRLIDDYKILISMLEHRDSAKLEDREARGTRRKGTRRKGKGKRRK